MQHLVHGKIGHPHGPVPKFPVKTVWALLDLKVAEDQRSRRRCRCFRRFVKRYPHQTRQAFAVHGQRPAARRAEADGFWQYFHGAPYSTASTRNKQPPVILFFSMLVTTRLACLIETATIF